MYLDICPAKQCKLCPIHKFTLCIYIDDVSFRPLHLLLFLAFLGSPQNNVYKYPDIYVCLYNFYGCDNQELEEDCVRSAQITEGGNSTAVFNQNGDDEQDLHVDAFLTDEVTLTDPNVRTGGWGRRRLQTYHPKSPAGLILIT